MGSIPSAKFRHKRIMAGHDGPPKHSGGRGGGSSLHLQLEANLICVGPQPEPPMRPSQKESFVKETTSFMFTRMCEVRGEEQLMRPLSLCLELPGDLVSPWLSFTCHLLLGTLDSYRHSHPLWKSLHPERQWWRFH